MSEKWSVDKFGFVTNKKEFFHMRGIKRVAKKEKNIILLDVNFSQLTITYSDPKEQEKDRDRVFKWFCDLMIKTEQSNIDYHITICNHNEAVLATQKKVIGEHIGVIK